MTALAGAQDRVTLKYVAQSTLRFDPTNPRFGSGGVARSQETIQGILEKEPHYAVELVPSFLENGYIDYEPLVVRADGQHFVVVEGNRRLAAIRHILKRRDEFGAKSTRIGDLDEIPVLIFPSARSEQRDKEQRVYLGVRHLFGFREWPPESKARYLDSQIKTGADLDRVTRELNLKRQDIQRYLVPYRLRKSAGDLWQKHKDQDFWVFGEGLNRTGIKSYIALSVDRTSMKVVDFDRSKLAYLLTFIYGTPEDRDRRIVRETRELSSLAKLLQNKRAAAALEKGKSLAETTVQIESLADAQRRLRSLLRSCRSVIERFRSSDDGKELLHVFTAFETQAKRFLKSKNA